jgi:hypothetical protein
MYHLPEDSAFFPEDRMRFYQRINVHLPEDRLCHFPQKSYYLFLHTQFFNGEQKNRLFGGNNECFI